MLDHFFTPNTLVDHCIVDYFLYGEGDSTMKV